MLKNKTWLTLDSRTFMAITMTFALATMLGCAGGGESSPITSNLSTTPSTESESLSAETDPLSANVASTPEDLHMEDLHVEDLHADEAEAPVGTLAFTEDQAEQNALPQPPGAPMIALNSIPGGASAEVMWQPSADSNVNGYYIYYGKQSAGEPGVCAYEARYAADSFPVTLMELEPNTPYFFAVSSYSSYESPCSNEIAVVTPPAGA